MEGNIHTDSTEQTWWMLGELNSKQATWLVMDPTLANGDYRFDEATRQFFVGPEDFEYLAYGPDDEDEMLFNLN